MLFSNINLQTIIMIRSITINQSSKKLQSRNIIKLQNKTLKLRKQTRKTQSNIKTITPIISCLATNNPASQNTHRILFTSHQRLIKQFNKIIIHSINEFCFSRCRLLSKRNSAASKRLLSRT